MGGGVDSRGWKVFCFQIRWNYSVLGPKSSPTHAHGPAPAPARKRHLGRAQQLPRHAAPAPAAPPAERGGFSRSPPGSGRSIPTTLGFFPFSTVNSSLLLCRVPSCAAGLGSGSPSKRVLKIVRGGARKRQRKSK